MEPWMDDGVAVTLQGRGPPDHATSQGGIRKRANTQRVRKY